MLIVNQMPLFPGYKRLRCHGHGSGQLQRLSDANVFSEFCCANLSISLPAQLAKECGKKFKGNHISKIVANKPGNESRTWWRHVGLPLDSRIMLAVLVYFWCWPIWAKAEECLGYGAYKQFYVRPLTNIIMHVAGCQHRSTARSPQWSACQPCPASKACRNRLR